MIMLLASDSPQIQAHLQHTALCMYFMRISYE